MIMSSKYIFLVVNFPLQGKYYVIICEQIQFRLKRNFFYHKKYNSKSVLMSILKVLKEIKNLKTAHLYVRKCWHLEKNP